MKPATRVTLSYVVLSLLGLFLAAFPRSAAGGPNGGGTLVVHDTGYWYTLSSNSYPSDPPASCTEVDAEMPLQIEPGYHGRVWKVYAAFTAGSTPRLKALCFAEDFSPSQVAVLAGGLPDPALDFEITEFGWPTTDGGAAGMSFGVLKTAVLSEVYWFAGYAYEQTPGVWSTAPHPSQASVFVDDSYPPLEDPIAAFSSIGFGRAGTTHCPAAAQACCLPLGSCEVLTPSECAALGGEFTPGTPCDPNPCTAAEACCFTDGTCSFVQPQSCFAAGGYTLGPGTDCSPNPCIAYAACCHFDGTCSYGPVDACTGPDARPMGPGSDCDPNPCEELVAPCCLADGSCWMFDWTLCALFGGTPLPGTPSCDPNPCTQPMGACCFPDGSCELMLEVDCPTGHWHYWQDCQPNPCPQLGACCHRDTSCEITLSNHCDDFWIEGPCDPNPCPALEGACCLADGSCELRLMTECGFEFYPQIACDPNPCPPVFGACCFGPGGDCLLLSAEECEAEQGMFFGGPCEETTCPMPVPIERMTWGRLKSRFRN